MVILEAGLLFRNDNLVRAKYFQNNYNDIYDLLRKELVVSLLDLIDSTFLNDIIEYIGGKQYIIVFIEENIMAEDTNELELLVAYCIVENKKKIDVYVNNIVLPQLRKTMFEFKTLYEVISVSEISQFSVFKKNLSKIFTIN